MNNSIRNLAQKKAGKKNGRTDAAGRSGMGESSTSNLKRKSPYGFSSAEMTGMEAYKKKFGSTGSLSKATNAYDRSINNAYKYDYDKVRRGR